jgi:ABC-2 type transport system ATP-binding protein
MTGDPGDLTRIKGVENVSVEGNTLRAQVDSESLGELIRVLGDAGVRSLLSQPPTLEELFLRHYKTGGSPDSKGQRGHSGKKVSAL